MKKLTLILTALLLVATLSAQPGSSHNRNPHGTFPAPPQAPSILVQAQNHEIFQVYIDGDLVNNVPNSEVLINNLDSRLHEVVVILTHPAHKAAATQLYAATPSPIITVSYDMRRQQMLLYSSQATGNYSGQGYGNRPHHHHGTPPTPPTPSSANVPAPSMTNPAVVADQWVDEMVAIIKSQSFDSEKLSTAKGLLSNGQLFTSSQIARIAKELGFNNSQVDFIKAAYPSCSDPQNYERVLSILTFSSDREAVRAFIRSQK